MGAWGWVGVMKIMPETISLKCQSVAFGGRVELDRISNDRFLFSLRNIISILS